MEDIKEIEEEISTLISNKEKGYKTEVKLLENAKLKIEKEIQKEKDLAEFRNRQIEQQRKEQKETEEFYKQLRLERNQKYKDCKIIEPIIDYDLINYIKDETYEMENKQTLKHRIDFFKAVISELSEITNILVTQIYLPTYSSRRQIVKLINDNIAEQNTEGIRPKRTANKLISLLQPVLDSLSKKYEELNEQRKQTKKEFNSVLVICDYCNKNYTRAHKARHLNKYCQEIKKI